MCKYDKNMKDAWTLYTYIHTFFLQSIPFTVLQLQLALENPLKECNPYVLHHNLADLTMWMNETLPLLNNSITDLELLVEKLNTTILPSVADALVSSFDLGIYILYFG